VQAPFEDGDPLPECVAKHASDRKSSGRTNRRRLARGGNRQLSAALHRIAVTQIRLDGLGGITSIDARTATPPWKPSER
jgi:transposase